MMPSKSEIILEAFFDRLVVEMPSGTVVCRNESLPARIPDNGWVCLRDGEPGAPDVLLSPLLYIYDHEAELDVLVQSSSAADRDEVFDALKVAIGAAIDFDRTLSGNCDYMEATAPVPVSVEVEGAVDIKAATVGVMINYQTSDPLA